MPGGDPIIRVVVQRPQRRELALELLLRAVCARFGHIWRPMGRPLRYGRREFCARCSTNRITLADGEEVEATGSAVKMADPRFAEALYEARWGDPPHRVLQRGEWPAT